MSRGLRLPLLVALLVIIFTSQALGAVNVGAKYLAGTFSMAADENDLYGAIFPLVVVDGEWEMMPHLTLGVELVNGTSGYHENDQLFEGMNWGGYSPYGYQSVKCEGRLEVSDNLSLLAGSTYFTGTWDYSNSLTDHDWFEAAGTAFKIGCRLSYPVNEKLTASVKYAFLPRVYVEDRHQDQPDDPDYVWLGSGHEVDARMAYTVSDQLTVECGYMCDIYSGITACCYEPEGESVSGLYLGVNWIL